MSRIRSVIHVEIWDLEALNPGDAPDVRTRHLWIRPGGLCGALEKLHLFAASASGPSGDQGRAGRANGALFRAAQEV